MELVVTSNDCKLTFTFDCQCCMGSTFGREIINEKDQQLALAHFNCVRETFLGKRLAEAFL